MLICTAAHRSPVPDGEPVLPVVQPASANTSSAVAATSPELRMARSKVCDAPAEESGTDHSAPHEAELPLVATHASTESRSCVSWNVLLGGAVVVVVVGGATVVVVVGAAVVVVVVGAVVVVVLVVVDVVVVVGAVVVVVVLVDVVVV